MFLEYSVNVISILSRESCNIHIMLKSLFPNEEINESILHATSVMIMQWNHP